MIRTLCVAMIIALILPAAVSAQNAGEGQTPAPGQNPLFDFSRQIKFDGLTMSIVYLNDKTVDILFQPPTKYSMRARVKQATFLYLQGTPQKDVNFDTAVFVEQGGQRIAGTPHNIKNFEKKKLAKGERIDGLIEFSTKIDVTKPFTVLCGTQKVDFQFSEDVLKTLGN